MRLNIIEDMFKYGSYYYSFINNTLPLIVQFSRRYVGDKVYGFRAFGLGILIIEQKFMSPIYINL